jgi:hypothetical protein
MVASANRRIRYQGAGDFPGQPFGPCSYQIPFSSLRWRAQPKPRVRILGTRSTSSYTLCDHLPVHGFLPTYDSGAAFASPTLQVAGRALQELYAKSAENATGWYSKVSRRPCRVARHADGRVMGGLGGDCGTKRGTSDAAGNTGGSLLAVGAGRTVAHH